MVTESNFCRMSRVSSVVRGLCRHCRPAAPAGTTDPLWDPAGLLGPIPLHSQHQASATATDADGPPRFFPVSSVPLVSPRRAPARLLLACVSFSVTCQGLCQGLCPAQCCCLSVVCAGLGVLVCSGCACVCWGFLPCTWCSYLLGIPPVCCVSLLCVGRACIHHVLLLHLGYCSRALGTAMAPCTAFR